MILKNAISTFAAVSFIAAFCALADLGSDLKPFTLEQTWLDKQEKPQITRKTLIQAIELSRAFYLNHQKPEGNFIYAIDIENGDVIDKDNQVRQAGALWGLACLNRDRFNEPTRRALLLGIDYFASRVQELPTGEKCFAYAGEENISTGAVALFCMALVEFLHGQEKYLPEKVFTQYRSMLDTHLAYIRSMEMPDGSWARSYNIPTAFRENASSPYFDGETLLLYCKAARYLGYKELLPRINDALPKLIKKYTLDCWKPDGDIEETKGFYQWGCMAMAEYVEAKWTPHAKLSTDAAIALSWWLLIENDVEHRLGNTGYAVEGLMGAWRIANATGDNATRDKLQKAILGIMGNLMTWQYKGPFMSFNPTLMAIKRAPRGADGGITYAKNNTLVRIDVQQHQTHAMLLMLKHLFPEK